MMNLMLFMAKTKEQNQGEFPRLIHGVAGIYTELQVFCDLQHILHYFMVHLGWTLYKNVLESFILSSWMHPMS